MKGFHRLRRNLPVLLAAVLLCGGLGLRWLYANRYVQPYIPEKYSLPILMYHHVVPDGEVQNNMMVTVTQLEEDFAWLAEQGYTPILPRDLAQGIEVPEKAVMITFDDGYRSNYTLAYPLLQKYQLKAVISTIVYMQEIYTDEFLTWDMCREMTDSGFVEIGSHTYGLHNLGGQGGRFQADDANGIQRRTNESDEEFQTRVLDDIQKSHDLLEEHLGQVCFFAYPYGLVEPDAQALVNDLFPVSVITFPEIADLRKGHTEMPRETITMEHTAKDALTENQWILLAQRVIRKAQRTFS